MIANLITFAKKGNKIGDVFWYLDLKKENKRTMWGFKDQNYDHIEKVIYQTGATFDKKRIQNRWKTGGSMMSKLRLAKWCLDNDSE